MSRLLMETIYCTDSKSTIYIHTYFYKHSAQDEKYQKPLKATVQNITLPLLHIKNVQLMKHR